GGNLAAMLGTSAGDQFTEDLSLGNEAFSSAVLATVVWFPPVDFTTIEAEAEALGFIATTDLEDAYMGFPVEDDPEATARANPTTYIDADDGAFLVQVGSADPLIPYTQSENFAAALSAELGADRVTFELLEGASHGGGEFESDDNLAQVLAFFNDHL
ncbi:MAG: prolyl oligopeptidase family serine peptidase, partial [Myxococcota bacterium]